MRFVVTGANGLVGMRLCTLLTHQGHDVVGLSRGESRLPRLEGDFTYKSCELTDGVSLRQCLEQARPEVILHPASMTEVDACERNVEQAFASNVRVTEYVAENARRLDAHVVYVSTDYVFDGDNGPYAETDIPNPRGVYATTKHMAEQVVRTLAPRWSIARTAVVYGWPPAGRPNFGSWLVSALAQGQRVKLFEDQFVSPSLADNVAEMLAEVGERQLGGIWHLSGAEVVDRVTFGRALCEKFGLDLELLSPIKMADAALPSPRPSRSGLKVTRAQAELTAKPLSLDEQLTRFLAAYRASPLPNRNTTPGPKGSA